MKLLKLKKVLAPIKFFFHYILFKFTNDMKYYERAFSFLSILFKDQKTFWNQATSIYNTRYSNDIPDKLFLKTVIKLSKKEQKILEFGCSTGFNLCYLYSKKYSFLTGIDISDRSINVAKKTKNQIKYYSLDLSKVDLNYNYDIIFARATFQHIPPNQINNIFYNLIKSLNKTGKLIFKEAFNKNEPFSRIENHRVYSTFNHNYFEILKRYNVKQIDDCLFILTI